MAQGGGLQFDLIDSCGYGYVRVWNERHYLLTLAMIPVLIKFICAVGVYVLGVQDDLLRQGLVMLPGTLAQGWVLAQFLRTLLLNERWPQRLPQMRDEGEIARLVLRARGIVSAALVFVLINMVSTVIAWGLLQLEAQASLALEQREAGTLAEGEGIAGGLGGLAVIPLVAFMLASIWAFRLAYLYIPFVVLMPLREYLARLGGFMASIRMLALYLICMVPCTVTATIMVQMLLSVAGVGEDVEPSALLQFFITFFGAIVEMITALIATAAMAYAFRDVVPHAKDALRAVGGDDDK